jgi:hypothetical protein
VNVLPARRHCCLVLPLWLWFVVMVGAEGGRGGFIYRRPIPCVCFAVYTADAAVCIIITCVVMVVDMVKVMVKNQCRCQATSRRGSRKAFSPRVWLRPSRVFFVSLAGP